MNLLLTSSGITNASIRSALTDLLGKPISESKALFVPTGMHPFPGGAEMVWKAIAGKTSHPMSELGWKSFGLLEPAVLSSLDRELWVPAVEGTDAILVWGGDVLFLCHWLRRSGLADVLAGLGPRTVYVGTSAGSMAACTTFSETYSAPSRGEGEALSSEEVVFATGAGDTRRTLVTARGMGFVDFALIPHFNHPHHEDASTANAAIWAAKNRAPTFAIDDDTAIQVKDGAVEVISEGVWKLFPGARAEGGC